MIKFREGTKKFFSILNILVIILGVCILIFTIFGKKVLLDSYALVNKELEDKYNTNFKYTGKEGGGSDSRWFLYDSDEGTVKAYISHNDKGDVVISDNYLVLKNQGYIEDDIKSKSGSDVVYLDVEDSVFASGDTITDILDSSETYMTVYIGINTINEEVLDYLSYMGYNLELRVLVGYTGDDIKAVFDSDDSRYEKYFIGVGDGEILYENKL